MPQIHVPGQYPQIRPMINQGGWPSGLDFERYLNSARRANMVDLPRATPGDMNPWRAPTSRPRPARKKFRIGQTVGGGRVTGFNPNGSPIISMGGGREGISPPRYSAPRPVTSKRKKASSGPRRKRGMRNRPY